jgi:hypothetical protein
MAITITGENVLLEAHVYDALCSRAQQATKLERVAVVVGELLSYSWEDAATNDDTAQAMKRLREAYEKL